jgi:hypothetical protein
VTTYASKTVVPIEKSRAEIEKMLTRYKATKFASGWSEHGAVIMFEARGKRVRFELPMPDAKERRFTHDHRGWIRGDAPRAKAYDQECRARWRAMALVIKAKLEAVDSGITTFEDEFLAHIVLPDGRTVSGWLTPELAKLDSGRMPPMLGMGSSCS